LQAVNQGKVKLLKLNAYLKTACYYFSVTNEEKRAHTRIQITAEARVSGPKGTTSGILKDLSKGGAGLQLSEAIGDVGDTIELMMDLPGGIEIAVMGEILRMQETEEGIFCGLRFNLVEPSMQEKLITLIESLIQLSGSTTRRHPRIVRRIPVHYGSPTEFKAMLENISKGGLAMTISKPLTLYEEIEVSIPLPHGKETFIVKGKIVYQHPIEKNKNKMYKVGLEFKKLSSAATMCLEEMIRHAIDL